MPLRRVLRADDGMDCVNAQDAAGGECGGERGVRI